ncbi:MAG: CGNR zinc finger domain-containing protein [Acidobacteria bacterium]|nr:CGNR zinc finger domain-containing protein [Acidobacteriota bacterium]
MTSAFENAKFFIVANNLSLDFVNTQIVENGEMKDLLMGFEDFVAWASAAGLLELPQAVKLVEDWRGRSEAEKIFVQAQDFRRILREMVERIVGGKAVKPSAIKMINAMLQGKPGYAELVKTEGGFEKRFHADFREPRQILSPIAESAADLLCYGDPAHLKKCESPACVLYFYDTTKNHSRRWCSMAGCGNRAKAAAFYQRQRERVKAIDS